MADSDLAFFIAAVGYGINILILGILAATIWGVSKFIENQKRE